ncbi:MAG: protein kinase [Ktedonobacteraceae bacterium]|nr:protein kinase [Ktedonobacteraceae bacterium]
MQSENVFSRQQSSDNEMNALIGQSLGQFRIVEQIGAGGMAVVFKAYQPMLDRYVAIKVLPSYHANDPVFLTRFVQEARSVAKLAHPNIVQIHDFGEQNTITYIVMEYVDGGTLKDRLKKPLPVGETIDYIIQAAQGLSCAHRNGIIHRDVKPANMLLRQDGRLLLSDFGIAKILEDSTSLTRVGTGIGTPQYISPEQSTGQAVDRRSDIYSLGIVLFHCLTGRVPFTAENPLSLTMKHLNEPLPVERLKAEGVPDAVIKVILQMAAKQPKDRYQSTEALIDALTHASTASNLSIARQWHAGASAITPRADLKGGAAKEQFTVYDGQASVVQPAVTLTCFRCGARNSSTRLYCTTCGDELANSRADYDRYLGPNGKAVLARLSMQNGLMAGHSYRFHQQMTTIGRTNGNDFIIAGRTVSRRHARLWFDNGRWYLEDLQSANGTLVNNRRIYQPVVLHDGDVINFGDEVAVFNVTYGP